MGNELHIGNLTLSSPILLAPMSGYSDLPFRLGVRGLGGLGMAFTEMMSPKSLLYGGGKRRDAMLAAAPEDQPLGHQIYGSDPALVADAAQWLAERGARLVDINMGCPRRKIASSGAGAALLKDIATAVAVARRAVDAVRIPVTAKIRLGWSAKNIVAEVLAAELEQAGVAAIAVHGRTSGQGYAGAADWTGIRRVVSAVERVPVIGNGDVTAPDSARALFSSTGCAGIMVGRAALRNPWLAREIWRDRQGLDPEGPPSHLALRDFVLAHFDRHVAQYGSAAGAMLFRKWLPQYVKRLGVEREGMAQRMRIRDAGEMRNALAQL